MNAAQLFPGIDYAHTDYLRRGVNYYSNANRVRVLSVRQEAPDPFYGEKRKKTIVEVLMCDHDGTVQTRITTDGDMIERTREVRARDIFSRWDEYAIVHNDREKERLEQDRIYEEQRAQRRKEYAEREEAARIERQQREERERIEAEERRIKFEAEREEIFVGLEKLGISRSIVQVSHDTVMINREKLKLHLALNEIAEGVPSA